MIRALKFAHFHCGPVINAQKQVRSRYHMAHHFGACLKRAQEWRRENLCQPDSIRSWLVLCADGGSVCVVVLQLMKEVGAKKWDTPLAVPTPAMIKLAEETGVRAIGHMSNVYFTKPTRLILLVHPLKLPFPAPCLTSV